MTVFKNDCPHCGTKSVAFTIISQWRAPKTVSLWDTLAYCGQCGRGILATFNMPKGKGPKDLLGISTNAEIFRPTVLPSPPSTGAPEHTPPNVSRFFTQGVENLPGNWDAAGSMFRKALEAALKNKFPDVEGDLYHRIEGAKQAGGMTADLAEWSHQIRLDGRNAVHEEKPYGKEDAERLYTFTNLVLLYLFTLPGMLKKARDDAAEETGVDPKPSSGQPPASDPGIQ